MTTVETVLVIILVLDALALVGLVLIQQGKGADVGAAFGSGSANTVFGSGGAGGFLTRITVWLAVSFFAISFALAYMASNRAATIDDLGIPTLPVSELGVPATGAATTVVAPEDAESAERELTNQAERVDSDIPKID